MAKRSVNLSLSAELVDEARSCGMNLSRVLDEKLRQALQAERQRQLQAEVAAFSDWYAGHHDAHGLWCDGLSTFNAQATDAQAV